MFGSSVLDVVIGLIFVFLLLSLICSAAKELIEVFIKKRAADLEKGIAELLGDPNKTSTFLKAFYNHGLINSLYRGQYKAGSKNLPSYIPASNFALAIIDLRKTFTTAKSDGDAAKGPASATQGVLPANVSSAISALENIAENDAKKLQAGLEAWYNSAMDRVSGSYKRRTQLIIMAMGVIIAIAVNADTIEISRKLSSDASLRQSIVAMAEATAKKDAPGTDKQQPIDSIKDSIKTLNSLGLPIGWPPETDPNKTACSRMLYALENHWFGWLLTAFAVSLGAPFWFDLLNKIIVVRSTVKPREKSQEEQSKDPKG